ncbi:HalX domain-containing protein [Halobaculum sp. MBLA0147]|uniref:HalX domain-containing protein n=1 Tax=Halobaculum sp. MBLA0147 TaxID=3079934 RepID=UPI003523122A
MSDQGPTVLVVDDEQQVADAYALRLQMEYDDVRKAYGGEEALATVDESVDVVLLDRRMPDYSGGEVLEQMRERGLDCSVIMVTAVDPDFDIVDMPFDDYLCKPVEKEALFDAIEQQLVGQTYDDEMDEYFAIVSKIGVLEAQKPSYELEDNEQYQELKERAEELRGNLDQTVQDFDDVESAFSAIDRN